MQRTLRHGVNVESNLIPHPYGPITSVITGPHPNKPLILSPGTACTYRGKAFDTEIEETSTLWLRAEEDTWTLGSFDSLVWLSEMRLYFAYKKGTRNIGLLTENFETIDTGTCSQRVHSAIMVPQRQYVFVAGDEALISVTIRHGMRLQERAQHPLAVVGNSVYGCSLLVISHDRPSQQKVFITTGPSISVHGLGGECLSGHNRLHHKAITAIRLRAIDHHIITGAADGVIKVWNKEFLIQCVFVGHSAAVRNINFLPSLEGDFILISISEDRTLRSWHTISMEAIQVFSLSTVFHTILPLPARPDAIALASSEGMQIYSFSSIHRLFALTRTHVWNMEGRHQSCQVIAASAQNNTLVLISSATRRVVARLNATPFRYTQLNSSNTCFESKSLASSNEKNNDISTPKEHENADFFSSSSNNSNSDVLCATYLDIFDCFIVSLTTGHIHMIDCQAPQSSLALYEFKNACNSMCIVTFETSDYTSAARDTHQATYSEQQFPCSASQIEEFRNVFRRGFENDSVLPRAFVVMALISGEIACLDLFSGYTSSLDNTAHSTKITHIVSSNGWDLVSDTASVVTVGADGMVAQWSLSLVPSMLATLSCGFFEPNLVSSKEMVSPLKSSSSSSRKTLSTDQTRYSIHFAHLKKEQHFFLSVEESATVHVIRAKQNLLWMVSSKKHSSKFELDCFNFEKMEQLTHDNRWDHEKIVTALACHEKVNITITASMDGTVRFWDPRNQPLLCCDIQAPIFGCCFHPTQFALLLSVHRNIHFVDVEGQLGNEDITRMRSLGLLITATSDEKQRFLQSSLSISESHHFWEEADRYGANTNTGDVTGESAMSTANATIPTTGGALHNTFDSVTASQEFQLIQKRETLDKRAVRLEAILNKRTQARNVTVTSPKSRKKDRKVLKDFVRTLYPIDETILKLRQLYTQSFEDRSLTAAQQEYLRELAATMPESQGDPSPVHIQANARCKYRIPLPLAPDGSIPNSVVWKQFLLSGVVPQDHQTWAPVSMTEEQLSAIKFKAPFATDGCDNTDDEEDEENNFMNLLSSTPEASRHDSLNLADLVEEDSHIEENTDEIQRANRLRLQRQRQYTADLTARSNPSTNFQLRKTPTTNDIIKPESDSVITNDLETNDERDVESISGDEIINEPEGSGTKEPIQPLPPLPRYLTQFRERSWFKYHFPRAVPSTFNHIRPFSDSYGTSPKQIPFSNVVMLLSNTAVVGKPPVAGMALKPGERRGLLFCTQEYEREQSIIADLGILSRHPDATHEDHTVIYSAFEMFLKQKPEMTGEILESLTLLAASMESGIPDNILSQLLFHFSVGNNQIKKIALRCLALLGFQEKAQSIHTLAQSWVSDCQTSDGSFSPSTAMINLIRQRISTFIRDWHLKLASFIESQSILGHSYASEKLNTRRRSTASRVPKQSLDFLSGAAFRLEEHTRTELPQHPSSIDGIDILNYWQTAKLKNIQTIEEESELPVRIHTPTHRIQPVLVPISVPQTPSASVRLPRVGYCRKHVNPIVSKPNLHCHTFQSIPSRLPPLSAGSHAHRRKPSLHLSHFSKLHIRPSDITSSTSNLALLETSSSLTGGHPSRLFVTSKTWID